MDEAPLQHTFLFADLSGFSALTEAHGDERAADLAQAFAHRLRPLLSEHRSAEVKSLGDGMMVRTSEPAQAIRLGSRVVWEVAGRDGLPLARVGIHTGPAAERGADWYGGTVNVAARLCAMAPPGDVLLTEATRQAAGEVEDLELESLGERVLRNVSIPVTVYRARRQGHPAQPRPVDPVCRMVVEPGHKVAMTAYRDHVYAFCSVGCAAAFAQNPERHLSS